MLGHRRFLELEQGRLEGAGHGPAPAAATLVFLHSFRL